MFAGEWRPGKAAFLVSILLLTIISAFSLIEDAAEDADALLPISAQFSFASDQGFRTGNLIEIRTGPGQTGQVIVNGTLEFFRSAKFLRTRIFIELNFASDNPEVTGSIVPRTIDMQPQAKLSHYPIKVNIQMAPMTKYSTGVSSLVNVTVFGTWEAKYQTNDIGPFASGEIPQYPLYVNVRPYHYLFMTFEPVMLELSPGSSGWVECIVRNNGNGFERVDLSIPGALAYAKSGWIFEFEETVINIGPETEASTRIKITSPRKIEPKYHMEMHDFSVLAVSYYSVYQVKDGDLEVPVEYEAGIFVQVNGIDFFYVPWMWTITIYLVMALILFNFGINPFTMRRRKTRDPGLIALYRMISDPKRRALAKARRDERRGLRQRDREMSRLEKQQMKATEVEKTRAPIRSSERPSPSRTAPVLDLKRTDKDFDIEIPSTPGSPKVPTGKAPLLGGRPKKRDRLEKDMIDVLSSLDD